MLIKLLLVIKILYIYIYFIELLFLIINYYLLGSLELRANANIKQIVEVVKDIDKYGRLIHYLAGYNDGSLLLIFVETKKGCDQLAHSLRRQGFPTKQIHGDKSQQERDQTLADFKAGKIPMLIATDVAARGLDVKNVKLVVNFDMPNDLEGYVHRIGRTGRAGATGTAISFFTDKSVKMANDLCEILSESNQVVPAELQAMCQQGRGGNIYG